MKVAFWNCSGTGNLGDDLCHEGAVMALHAMLGIRQFDFLQIFRLNDITLPQVNECDYLVIGGGQLLDRADFADRIVKYKPKPEIMFIGVGVGESKKRILKNIEAGSWLVRDYESLEILKSIGKKAYRLGDASEYAEIKPWDKRGGIALCLKNTNKDRVWKRAVGAAIKESGLSVTLLAFNSLDRHVGMMNGEKCWVSDCNDKALAEEIEEYSGSGNVSVLSYHDNPLDFAGAVNRFDFLIGERFHSIVLAQRFGVPFRAICYHDKVNQLLKDSNRMDCAMDGSAESIREILNEIKRKGKGNANIT